MSSILEYALTLDPALATEPVDMIGSLFPRGYVTIVAGEPGVGKTWFMLSIARAIADGLRGLGDPINPYNKGKVLIFAGETGVRMLVDRMNHLGTPTNLNSIQVVSSHQMARMNIDVMLNTAVGRKNIEGAIADFRPDIVFVDTVISFMGDGKDESSQVDMSDSIRMLGSMANTYNAAIVLLHHFRKNKASNAAEVRSQNEVIGTSAFIRLASQVIGVERKGDCRIVNCLKSWWKEFEPFMFKIRTTKEGGVVLDQSYTLNTEGGYSTIPVTRRILAWISENFAEKDFTAGEIIDGCGVGRTSVISAIQAGQSQGLIKLVKKDGNKHIYSLAPQLDEHTHSQLSLPSMEEQPDEHTLTRVKEGR